MRISVFGGQHRFLSWNRFFQFLYWPLALPPQKTLIGDGSGWRANDCCTALITTRHNAVRREAFYSPFAGVYQATAALDVRGVQRHRGGRWPKSSALCCKGVRTTRGRGAREKDTGEDSRTKRTAHELRHTEQRDNDWRRARRALVTGSERCKNVDAGRRPQGK